MIETADTIADFVQNVPHRFQILMNVDDMWFNTADSAPDIQPSCPQIIDGVNYLHVKVNGLLFVATTRANVSPALILELLQRIARIIKDYCGILSEDSMRKNFVLVYELLDEIIVSGSALNFKSGTCECDGWCKDTLLFSQELYSGSFFANPYYLGLEGPNKRPIVPRFSHSQASLHVKQNLNHCRSHQEASRVLFNCVCLKTTPVLQGLFSSLVLSKDTATNTDRSNFWQDMGYAQSTSTESLKAYVFNEPIQLDVQKLPNLGAASIFMNPGKRVPGTAVTKSVVSNDPSGKKREEVFVDIIERVSVTFNASVSAPLGHQDNFPPCAGRFTNCSVT